MARIADDLMLELDDLLPAVRMAEMLGFLRIEAGDLILTDDGKRFLSKGSSGRKKILNQAVARTGVFKAVIEFIGRRQNREVTKDELLDFLREQMPDMEVEPAIQSIVEWGRHSLLLQYTSTNKKIKLIQDGRNEIK